MITVQTKSASAMQQLLKWAAALLFCVVLTSHASLAQITDDVPVATFSKNLDGFTGTIARDPGHSHDAGGASARIDADFSDPENRWVTATKLLTLKGPIKKLTFFVRTENVTGLTVRMVDSTGQKHQLRPTWTPGAQWQQVTIDRFDGGQGYEAFDGADDKKFHWPAESVSLLLETTNATAADRKASIWVDDVVVTVDSADVPASPEPTQTVTFADFNKDTGGFNGSVTHAPAEGREVSGALRFNVDLTAEAWTTSVAPLNVANKLEGVRFWVKSSDVSGCTFRAIDSTGQTHQLRPTWRADGTWQEVSIDSFTIGVGHEAFGGAGDRKFHWPATHIGFVVEKANVNLGNGTLLVDDVTLLSVGAPKDPSADWKPLLLGNFDAGVDGFGAPGQQSKDAPHAGAGALKIAAQFRVDEPWVSTSKTVDIDYPIKRLTFWARSTDTTSLTLRYVDSTGQNHQARPTWRADGTWQKVTIDDIERTPNYESFGGANDRKVHWPVKQIVLLFEKKTLVEGKTAGAIYIDDLTAMLSPDRVISPLQIRPAALGNVFEIGEPVVVPVISSAEKVDWTARDFFGREVGKGTVAVRDAEARIEPDVRQPGWYELTVSAAKNGQPVKTIVSSFAIISPIDFQSLKGQPFGVMTHFAQGWDIDIFPLLVKAGITTIRDELYWDHVERTPGQYDFAKFQPYMDEAKRLGIEPLICLDFANANYDNGKTPHTPEGYAAFARYGQAVLKQYGDQIQALEIWNEYNGSFCEGPAMQDRPKHYAGLLDVAYKAIKEVRPDVAVGGGAAVLVPIPWFRDLFSHGSLEDFDAAVVHPYRATPEGVELDLQDLRQLMLDQKKGNAKPVWVTETGRIDPSEEGRWHVARYLTRMYTLQMSEGVEKFYWYLARDYQNFVSMGLTRDENNEGGRYAVAPAYVAYATLIRQLQHASFSKREATDSRVRVYTFSRGDQQIRVAWATVPSHVSFQTDGPLTIVDLVGGEQILSPVNGQIALTLTENAVYIKGPVRAVGAAKPVFAIAPRQQFDVSGAPRLRFDVDNTAGSLPMEARIRIGAQEASINAAAGQRGSGDVTMTTLDMQRPSESLHWYTVDVDGKPAATGGVVIDVVDPVHIEQDVAYVAPGKIRLHVVNDSDKTAYQVRTVKWTFALTQGETLVDQPLLSRSRLAIIIDTNVAEPYRPAAFTAMVVLGNREPVDVACTLSDNPAPRFQPDVNGQIEEWVDRPAITLSGATGKAWLAYDEQTLHIAARVSAEAGSQLRFAVAPAAQVDALQPPTWGEFVVAEGAREVRRTLGSGDVIVDGAKVAVSTSGDSTVYEISIPWTALSPATRDAGLIRFAIQSGLNGPANTGVFGGGIAQGKTPAEMPIIRLVGVEVSNASVSSLATAPRRTGHILADSEEDFSNVQGRQGWKYGYFDGTDLGGDGNQVSPTGPYTDDNFKPMEFGETIWDFIWKVPSVQYLGLTRGGAHPQMIETNPVFAVRRWTGDVEGPVEIRGTIGLISSEGDGVDLMILADGVIIHREHVLAPDAGTKPGFVQPFTCRTTLKPGTLVDIAIGPKGNALYDGTDCTIQIEKLELVK